MAEIKNAQINGGGNQIHRQELFLPTFSPWVLPGPANLAHTDTGQLLDKAQSEVLDPCQRRGIAGVQSLGFHPLFDHIRLVEARGSDWLIFPMDQDPIYRSGQFPTPRRVLQHLKSVDRAGAHFDSLYVAHEIPKGVAKRGKEAEVLRIIAPPPPSDIVQLSATLGRVSMGSLLAAFPASALANAVKTGLALGAVVAAAPLFLLDPIIFGAVTEKGSTEAGEPAFFFVLASWKWK